MPIIKSIPDNVPNKVRPHIGKTAKLNKEIIITSGPYANNNGIKIIFEKGDIGTIYGIWHRENDPYYLMSEQVVFQCGNTKYLVHLSDLDFNI